METKLRSLLENTDGIFNTEQSLLTKSQFVLDRTVQFVEDDEEVWPLGKDARLSNYAIANQLITGNRAMRWILYFLHFSNCDIRILTAFWSSVTAGQPRPGEISERLTRELTDALQQLNPGSPNKWSSKISSVNRTIFSVNAIGCQFSTLTTDAICWEEIQFQIAICQHRYCFEVQQTTRNRVSGTLYPNVPIRGWIYCPIHINSFITWLVENWVRRNLFQE